MQFCVTMFLTHFCVSFMVLKVNIDNKRTQIVWANEQRPIAFLTDSVWIKMILDYFSVAKPYFRKLIVSQLVKKFTNAN
jgi:hypothetical protein